MAKDSSIAWTDATFNPWIGCKEVSSACDNCYAREFMTRKPRWATAWSGDRFRTSPSNWAQPLKWNAEAKTAGVRRKVFCASLADVFDNRVPAEWRADLFELIDATPHLDWLLLTKRPQNIGRLLSECNVLSNINNFAALWPNIWLGTTVENQTEADRRIPHLLAIPATIKFLSCEPLLGQIRFSDVPGFNRVSLSLRNWWVIVGGESGKAFREMNPDWARSLRDQCKIAGVPFFMKQMNGKSQRSMQAIPDDLMIRSFPS